MSKLDQLASHVQTARVAYDKAVFKQQRAQKALEKAREEVSLMARAHGQAITNLMGAVPGAKSAEFM